VGDITGFLSTLNLSPVNTVLLAFILFFLNRAFSRIESIEKEHLKILRDMGFLKGHLNLFD